MTHLELISAVSDLVAGGVTLSTSTHPTKAQVTEWLNSGQRFIATIMPKGALHELVTPASYVYTSAPYLTDFGTDVIDVLDVAIDFGSGRVPAQLLEPKAYQAAGAHEFMGTATSPVACVMGERIQIYPNTSGTMYINYWNQPADLSGDSDVSDLDHRFAHALVVYAIAQFYKQNEQLDLYAKYFNEFITILKGA